MEQHRKMERMKKIPLITLNTLLENHRQNKERTEFNKTFLLWFQGKKKQSKRTDRLRRRKMKHCFKLWQERNHERLGKNSKSQGTEAGLETMTITTSNTLLPRNVLSKPHKSSL